MRLPALTPLQRTFAKGGVAAIIVILLAVAADYLWPPDHLAELPPLKPVVTSDQRLIVGSPERLYQVFNDAGYDLAAIRRGKARVPYMLLREWPEGFDAMEQNDKKKELFKRALLPLILHVNRTIVAQRRALEKLLLHREAGHRLSHRERAWLRRLAALYRTKPEKTTTLLRRVAPIPPSLAIAQAATETGWGTSRFARHGNAMFGQWTYDKSAGLKPRDADANARHAVKVYDRLIESAWDYARNLNTNRAYSHLRAARGRGVTDGLRLAGALERYSERGTAYVKLIRSLIRQNKLVALDKARLRPIDIPSS